MMIFEFYMLFQDGKVCTKKENDLLHLAHRIVLEGSTAVQWLVCLSAVLNPWGAARASLWQIPVLMEQTQGLTELRTQCLASEGAGWKSHTSKHW